MAIVCREATRCRFGNAKIGLCFLFPSPSDAGSALPQEKRRRLPGGTGSPKKKTMLRIGRRGDTPPQNRSCIGTWVPISEPSETGPLAFAGSYIGTFLLVANPASKV